MTMLRAAFQAGKSDWSLPAQAKPFEPKRVTRANRLYFAFEVSGSVGAEHLIEQAEMTRDCVRNAGVRRGCQNQVSPRRLLRA